MVVKKSKLAALWKLRRVSPYFMRPMVALANQRQIHFSQIGLLADDQRTPTGEMVPRKFSVES
jgi:hypothetical protein